MEEWFEWFIVSERVEILNGEANLFGVLQTVRLPSVEPTRCVVSMGINVTEEFKQTDWFLGVIREADHGRGQVLEEGMIKWPMVDLKLGRQICSKELTIGINHPGRHCIAIFCGPTPKARHCFEAEMLKTKTEIARQG